MINRSRAANAAYLLGIGSQFVRDGRAYGPHGKMTLAFHTHGTKYDARTAEILSLMTALANYSVRDYGVKPYLGPAALITEGIRLMRFPTKGRKRSGVLYASPFLPSNRPDQSGAFFGCRVRAEPAAATFTPFVQQPYLPQIMDVLERSHRYVQETSQNPAALKVDPYEFTNEGRKHPAFHPHVMRSWEEAAAKS
ncbi:hypothetical protein FJY90_08375 [Candidatus Gottesmanbacteria bacterium]|nr:hypothetical protein [Candidatus Gottesmanbacteria bacterium]